jgi:hypothetical protein
MGRRERTAGVFDRRTEQACGELVFLVLDAFAARVPKEESNHHVVERAVDEAIDDDAQARFAPELLEQTGGRHVSRLPVWPRPRKLAKNLATCPALGHGCGAPAGERAFSRRRTC